MRTSELLGNSTESPPTQFFSLCGVNGIPELAKHFDKWRPAPKQDALDVVDSVMRQIEHWAHRLQPAMNFDDFLKRAQKLGHKKTVKVRFSTGLLRF